MIRIFLSLLLFLPILPAFLPESQGQPIREREYYTVLQSREGHQGSYAWVMQRANEIQLPAEKISGRDYQPEGWLPAIVPGTVLNSLVHNRIYPEPYYGLNNKFSERIIPDLSESGRDFYTYWFRTKFHLSPEMKGKRVWMQIDGINYRAEIWLNSRMVGNIAGMFCQDCIDITDYVDLEQPNIVAIKVFPVDNPGGPKNKNWGAIGEFRNGGDGEIGTNVTMLMTVGWDFNFLDGIRDRNTGIWRSVSIFTTGKMALRHPFVRSRLSDNYRQADQTISVEVRNPNYGGETCVVKGEILGENIHFEKQAKVERGENKTFMFTPEEFPQLVLRNPRLWWPLNKGKQELYNLCLKLYVKGRLTDSITTRFGIREITSDQNTPDKSRTFYVNGKPVFIRGTNWIPEGMLRCSDERTLAELRYTRQAGINLIRFWGGGIAESDYFYQLCDEMGFLVWQEFWMTGDTKHPQDESLYLANVASTVKRIRNHPCLAYYVSSNESTEVSGTRELLEKLDGTRGYQMQSECAGVHDGSPYKQVNPMRYYDNTASSRGSRIDGFNPEYGTSCLPTVEVLREMMDEKDLWPINKAVWDYHDGGGFHEMTTLYKQLTDEYGPSESIEEFAQKAQFVGAMSYRSIWEVWNYNKLHYGDRYCSGLLFWYHQNPVRQVCGRMWDWSLEPTAALYYSQNALEPLHAQFDYLKNTVSVVNDYLQEFKNYEVIAEIYDLNSRRVKTVSARTDIPEDGVVNDILRLDFPKDITPVHFIKLRLKNGKGKEVAQSFYWRSNNRYEGPKTLTGPATAGFSDLSKLPQTRLEIRQQTKTEAGKLLIEVSVKNQGKKLAFFNQLQLLDEQAKPVRPSFYSDNFFSLLPGEEKTVVIETGKTNQASQLVVKGWNVRKQEIKLKTMNDE